MLGAPWSSTDIGAVGVSGRAAKLDDTFILSGDGADIWDTSDAFRFAYQPVVGSGSVTAHVAGANSLSGQQEPHEFAKAGVMLRESLDPSSPSVVLDGKPDGKLEFMARYANGEATHFLAGAAVAPQDVWLRLSRQDHDRVTAAYSSDGVTWTSLGTVSVLFPSDQILAGLAVTSHQPDALYAALFDHVVVSGQRPNLLMNGDFEWYDPPALGPPGWISDHAFRQSPAKSETHQPHSGQKNGACWTSEYLDCGIYQEVVAPVTGEFKYRVYASADRVGGFVGVNVNGVTVTFRNVNVRSFGDYRPYNMTFNAQAGDVIRVWMYSPPWPGYVVIDDTSLTLVDE